MRIFDTQIIPDTAIGSITYKMDISQRSQMGMSIEDNRVYLEAEKRIISKDNDGFLYQVNVENRIQQSSKQIRKMEEDLSFLQKKLIVRTDDEGRLTQIVNQYAIYQNWEDYKRTFYKKFKKDKDVESIISDIDELLKDNLAFLKVIKESEIGSLLFPTLYKSGLEEDKEFIETKEYEDFFGEISLPIVIKTKLKKRDRKERASHFYCVGKLDEDHFDHQGLRRNFRKLSDNYKLAVNVELDYMETYKLNKNHWITHGGQLFRVDIKGLFNFEQVVRFAPLNNDYGG